ncbi:MAG: hypothetical protein JW837_06645 [Sedimentisphaerales bacterium]|nr:hypothetical protein [Sedimentisphaerales bacterium]
MVKTLRITSILAVALAVVLVVFSVVFGVRSDAKISGLVSEPNVIEKFNQSEGNKVARGPDEVSPLVQQAGSFALYLNPPAPKPRPVTGRSGVVKRAPSATPKFKVLATSYYKDRPEMSIALIDEPGKGLNWVRQSGKVGHLFIEQIKDGVIVVKDDNGTFELEAEQKPYVSLLEGAPSVGSKGASIPSEATSETDTESPVKSSVYSGRAVSRATKLPKASPQLKTGGNASAVMNELTYKLGQLRKIFESDKTGSKYTDQQKAEMYNELISEFKASQSSRLSTEDLENLDDTTERLKEMIAKPAESGQK